MKYHFLSALAFCSLLASPALAAGSLNDIVVTNSQGTTGTLEKGWVADFLDVPPAQQFYSNVTTLVTNAITAGIGGGFYGVDQPTLRQQMAVFLLKAKYGICYVPPGCTGVFPDVPCPSTFANWIEDLAAQGITGGCGGGNYCPQNPVRRDQMAVFLLKASTAPHTCRPNAPASSPMCPALPSSPTGSSSSPRSTSPEAVAAATTARSTTTRGVRWPSSS